MVNYMSRTCVGKFKTDCPYCRESHSNDLFEYKSKLFCSRNCLNGYKKAEKFIKKYKDNPIMFVEDVMGVKLKWYQKQVLKKLSKMDRPYTVTMTRR